MKKHFKKSIKYQKRNNEDFMKTKFGGGSAVMKMEVAAGFLVVCYWRSLPSKTRFLLFLFIVHAQFCLPAINLDSSHEACFHGPSHCRMEHR